VDLIGLDLFRLFVQPYCLKFTIDKRAKHILSICLWPRRCLFVDNMAEKASVNAVDGSDNGACSNAYSWKDRKCNIALITGITGQVNTMIHSSCHNLY